MTTPLTSEQLAEALKLLVEELDTLASDFAPIVQDAVRLARETPLDDVEARDLYTRVLTVLRTAGRELSPAEHTTIADSVRTEAAALLAARQARAKSTVKSGGLTFHERNGLTPRAVVPMQTFNGQPIALTEGYVDVNDLELWAENHRVQLYVQEFRDINHREPDEDELLDLMHGELDLAGDQRDPFKLENLADSIARKGVERPPIVTWEGEPKDGNRRIAASKLVLEDDKFSTEQKERARWIRVWQAPKGTTDDQFEAIVVALNFEPDHKVDWPEYVKARLVARRFAVLVETRGAPTNNRVLLQLRREVADQFAIKQSEVKRYLQMVRWADDFEEYLVEERGADEAAVRYKANDVFQWFYEIQAGKGSEKIIEKITQDDDLRAIVYDLMYDVFDSGVQVRSLHKIAADENALDLLKQAHDDPNREEALKLVDAAIAEAAKNSPTRKLGFEQFLKNTIDRLGTTPPDQWRLVDVGTLENLHRVFRSSLGAIDGVLEIRSEP